MQEQSQETFNLTALKIIPESSNIPDPIKISFDFSLTESYKNWEWIVKYTVDVAYKRAVLVLYTEKIGTLNVGKYTKEITVPKIATEGIPKKDLMNVGMLSICGVDNGKEIVTINIVSQITKNEKGELVKTLLSPLE